MDVLAVSTFDIVAGSCVEHRDAQVLVDLLPNGAAFNLLRAQETSSAS